MQNFNAKLENWDEKFVRFTGRIAVPFARFSIFIIYFYFGIIKIFSLQGAATPMVWALLDKVLPGTHPVPFLIAFGVLEILIGLIFIIPRFERLGLFLLALHIFTTILPLFILLEFTWKSFLIPTIEGQYIIKNILIVALAFVIFASLKTLKEDKPH